MSASAIFNESSSEVANMLNLCHDETSEIQNYFLGKTVFLTGATGFLGKMLTEKLLRTCGVERIYVLVREKKGKEPAERLKELYHIPAFEPLKKLLPNFAEKIYLCLGDCLLPDLGLSLVDVEILKNEVDCVLHCAATVRFDASLRKATYINVRATRDLLKMAKEMKRLSSFIHVSTAFSHCPRKDIDEVFFESSITGEKLIELVDALEDDILDSITSKIINVWPNTYSFTKAIAEETVQTEGRKLPLSVFRPSIIVCALKEPLPGWIDNFYGPIGVVVASGLGIMRTLHCDKKKKADMVPVDYVTNGILAAACNVGQKKEPQSSEQTVTDGERVPIIYNYVSGCRNPITWDSYKKMLHKNYSQVPSSLIIWFQMLIYISNWYLHLLCDFFLHTIPAYIVDFFLYCFGKKPLFVDAYKKIRKMNNVLSYFTMREWNIKDTNVRNLWNKLNTKDRELFEFDIARLEWNEYIRISILGGRMYLLKDPLDTIPKGKRKLFMFTIAHYSLICALSLLLCFVLKLLFTILFN